MILASLLYSALIDSILMLVTWGICVRIQNAGFVDAAWAAGFSLNAALYGFLAQGYPPRKSLILFMAAIWSVRLTVFLLARLTSHHPSEDPRYQELRRRWASNLNLKFFFFFQAQALLIVILSVPFLLAASNPAPEIKPLEWAGLALWCLALAGESLADRQMQKFKRDPANKGKVCESGLWRYSRHPNYFFEWLIWCSYFVFALASPLGWITVYCPLLMLYFLIMVTGIPMAEEQSLKTRGDAYRRYQQTTSVFFPWFRKA